MPHDSRLRWIEDKRRKKKVERQPGCLYSVDCYCWIKSHVASERHNIEYENERPIMGYGAMDVFKNDQTKEGQSV